VAQMQGIWLKIIKKIIGKAFVTSARAFKIVLPVS
jgi:hypothetical protein